VSLSWARWHRLAGQVHLVAAAIGALLAIHLGVTIKYEGSRVPLALFGIVWLGFSVAAWVCARRRDFVAHERFMIRGYLLAMAFVGVRVMDDFQHEMFPFIGDEAVRDTTRGWLSFVAPMLAAETWLS
jgi:Na+/melibiose symporter-like transporter